MDVLVHFGRHAGEIRDIEPGAALVMLADGRASRPYPQEIADAFELLPVDLVKEVESRTFAPTEIASPAAVRPEELVEVETYTRKRSRR